MRLLYKKSECNSSVYTKTASGEEAVIYYVETNEVESRGMSRR